MAAQLGRALLLKVGDGGTPTEVFTTLSGQTTGTMTRNGQIVDVTTKDSDAERELLADGGIKSTVITVSGQFTDNADITTLNTQYDAQTIDNYQFVIPGSTAPITYEGGFQISSFEFSGDTDTGVTYSATFESSGALTVS